MVEQSYLSPHGRSFPWVPWLGHIVNASLRCMGTELEHKWSPKQVFSLPPLLPSLFSEGPWGQCELTPTGLPEHTHSPCAQSHPSDPGCPHDSNLHRGHWGRCSSVPDTWGLVRVGTQGLKPGTLNSSTHGERPAWVPRPGHPHPPAQHQEAPSVHPYSSKQSRAVPPSSTCWEPH
jgi:hypothetical protein